jgi:hypothetical protein
MSDYNQLDKRELDRYLTREPDTDDICEDCVQDSDKCVDCDGHSLYLSPDQPDPNEDR